MTYFVLTLVVVCCHDAEVAAVADDDDNLLTETTDTPWRKHYSNYSHLLKKGS